MIKTLNSTMAIDELDELASIAASTRDLNTTITQMMLSDASVVLWKSLLQIQSDQVQLSPAKVGSILSVVDMLLSASNEEIGKTQQTERSRYVSNV